MSLFSFFLFRLNSVFFTILSVVLNALLLHVILRHTPKELKHYSRLLQLICVTDFLLAATNFLGMQVITSVLPKYTMCIWKDILL